MADCDHCGAQQYRGTWLGPKNTNLVTQLRWLCSDCDRGLPPVQEVIAKRPLWQWYPIVGAAFWLAVILTVLVVFG